MLKNKFSTTLNSQGGFSPNIVGYKMQYIYNAISGIWNSYGCLPDEEEGIFITLEESSEDTSASLINLLGFDAQVKKIGRMTDSKVISECIVLLPMARYQYASSEPDEKLEQPTPPDPCDPCPENDPCAEIEEIPVSKLPPHPLGLYPDGTESAYLFKIRESVINKILGVKDYKKLKIRDIQTILENKQDLNKDNNIVKLMVAMVNYNFPPHLNWLLHKSIPPLAMYTQIVTHTLSQKDLTNIWQGIMPEIAENPEEVEFEIEHYLGDEELFGGYSLIDVLDYETAQGNKESVVFKVFKVKQRAHNSYEKEVVKDEYKFTYFNANEPYNKWYNSNWPYDNFSLVELLRVDAGAEHDFITSAKDPKLLGVLMPYDSSSVSKEKSVFFAPGIAGGLIPTAYVPYAGNTFYSPGEVGSVEFAPGLGVMPTGYVPAGGGSVQFTPGQGTTPTAYVPNTHWAGSTNASAFLNINATDVINVADTYTDPTKREY